MGFYSIMEASKNEAPAASLDLLHQKQCIVCPLNCHAPVLKNPHMKPTGARRPLVYMLGEAPGADEDTLGRQFVGKAGDVLRFRIPERWLPDIRWNNVVRTRPPKNRDPTITELECCRPSIIKDLEETKPEAIFGFGNIPLLWATGMPSGITKWSGRKIPVQIGTHKCWYFPIVHPSAISRSRKFEPRKTNQYGSDDEFAFAVHLKQAFAAVEKGLPEPIIHSPEFARKDVEIVTGKSGDLQRFHDFLWSIKDDPECGFDYETNGERPYRDTAKILSAAISSSERTMAVALEHPGADWSKKDLDVLFNKLRHWLLEYEGRKISHGLDFELEWSGVFFGKEVIRAGKWGDSLSQAYILDERQGAKKLGDITLMLFGIDIKKLSRLDRKHLEQCNVEDVLLYNGIDSKYHRLVYGELREDLKHTGMMPVYNSQLRRVPTMALTQMKGIPVDVPTVQKFERTYKRQLEEIADDIQHTKEVKRYKKLTGKPFNPASNQQVLKILTMHGHRLEKVDEDTLATIKSDFSELILEFRGVAKVISTYVEPLLPGSPVLYEGDLLHPVISTTVVRTWRTSAKDPNEQNYPKHKHREVRRQIKAKKGYKIVAFDFAGIQARNVAMESLDTELIEAFWNDYDIHTDWAKETIALHPRWIKEGLKEYRLNKDVQKKYRQISKNQFVFASFFGAFPPTLARGMEIPEEIAKKLNDKFWKRFPQIKDWHELVRENYLRDGYVTGLSGFRRHAPVASTEIINTPIQSDEALIVCEAMSRLSEMNKDHYQANMEIHDDLTFIWEENKIDLYAETVAKEMTRLQFPWMATVPIIVEMSIGSNWADLKEVAKFSSIEIWNHKRHGKPNKNS